ncbi:MAG: cache domain-containing protein, partial [Chloroflexi bacterium]|nr:cache domain-containing protein [Chloroflexota bacterium]
MTISWKLLLVFFLLAVGIGVAGFLYLENQQAFIKRHQEEELAAIADLKVGQIVNWRQERISDAEAITQNPLLARTVQQWRTEPDAAWLKPELLGWLTALRQAYGYRNAFLLDTEGALLLASPERDGPFDPNRIHLALQAARTQQALLSDLHSDAGATNAHLDLVAPLLSVQGGESVPVAVVLLEIAPDEFLYPMIQSWPTPSESVETLLVERDGDDVLYLNDLRFRKNAALALRLPLSTERLPAAAAVRGYEGILAGIDYRGVPVWAAARAIPNSPWSLVAKIDAAE